MGDLLLSQTFSVQRISSVEDVTAALKHVFFLFHESFALYISALTHAGSDVLNEF